MKETYAVYRIFHHFSKFLGENMWKYQNMFEVSAPFAMFAFSGFNKKISIWFVFRNELIKLSSIFEGFEKDG